MPLLFERFIVFFHCIEDKGQSGLFIFGHVNTTRKILIFFPLLCICVWQRDNHTEIYHHCFEAFSSFMVVFTTAVRLNLTSKVSIDFFYVFILTEINNSHNIVGRLLMSWLTSMFSSFSPDI